MLSLWIERGYLARRTQNKNTIGKYLNSKWREFNSDRKEIILSQIIQKKMGEERRMNMARINHGLLSKFMEHQKGEF